MKKILFLSLTLLISCISHYSVIAHDQDVAKEEATAELEQRAAKEEDEATWNRMVKTEVFRELIKKVEAGEMDLDNLVYFALDWAQELEKSEDPKDQELSYKLYRIVIELTEKLQALQAQEDDTQESSETN